MPIEIVPDIYDITCRGDPDGKRYRAFLSTVETPTLFDTGFAETVDALEDGIAEIGTEPERVIITHADPDHAGGLDAVVDRYAVETWVPKQSDLDLLGLETVPDHRYGDGDDVGRFTAVHTPGHEPDNHVLIDEATGIAIMGDAVSGADQRGLEPGRFHLPPAHYSADLNQAEESLERLLEYEFDVGLVFHGSSVTEDARTKLDRYVNFPGK